MEENKERNCWFPILLGLLGLALLFLLATFFGKGRASNLTKRATEVAQEALVKNQYSFASVEVGFTDTNLSRADYTPYKDVKGRGYLLLKKTF